MNDPTLLGLERLESRLLLAADVARQGDTLKIESDGAGDFIEISQDGAGNVLVAIDEDYDGGIDFYAAYAGIDNVVVEAGGGDDVVVVRALDIAGDLLVDLGSGDDFFYLGYFADADFTGAGYSYSPYFGASTIGGDLVVAGREGQDLIAIGDAYVAGNLVIGAGKHDDLVYVFALYDDLTVGGNTLIQLGGGEDYVSVYGPGYGYDVAFNGEFTLKAKGGDDACEVLGEVDFNGAVRVGLGNGEDYLRLSGLGAGAYVDVNADTRIKLGGDDDYVYLYGYVAFNGDLRLHGGGGYDYAYNYDYNGTVFFNGDVRFKSIFTN